MIGIMAAMILGGSLCIGFMAFIIWKKESAVWKIFPGIYTFTPALLGILFSYLFRGEISLGSLSFRFTRWSYILAGLWIPVLYYIFNLGLHLLFKTYSLKANVDWKKIIPTLIVSPIILMIFVAGEEIGWRGFLQTPLTIEFGVIPGLILLGLGWGFWHAPIALRGHNLKNNPLLETFILYPIMCVVYSFPLGYLTIHSGSIIPALVFHSINNTLGSVGAEIFQREKPKLETLIHITSGIVMVIIFMILFQKVK